MAVVVVVHVVLAWPLKVPIIHPDELGYLQNARFLARGGIHPETEYYPGYSLLLVPLWLMSNDPVTVWRGALLVNTALSAGMVVLVWRIAGRFASRLSRPWRAAMVAVTLAYPPIVLYGEFSMAETAFATAFLGVVAVGCWALDGVADEPGVATPAVLRWATFGLAAGLLALVHPRGYAVVVAVAVVAVVCGARRGRGLAVATGAGAAVGVLVTRAIVTAVKSPTSRFAAYNPTGIVDRSLSLHGAISLLSEAGGQMFYLSVASLGLVPLGVWLGVRALRAVIAGDRRAPVVLRAFVALSFLGVWALSALFMNLGTRADKLIYGRYDDAVVLPLILVALAYLLGAGRADTGPEGPPGGTRRDRGGRRQVALHWLTVGGVTTVVSGLALALGHGAGELNSGLNSANVLGLAAVLGQFRGHIDVIALVAIGVGGITVLSVVVIRNPVIVLALVFAAWAWSVVDTQSGYVIPGSRARAAENIVPTTLAALRARTSADLSCVGWDATAEDDYFYYATEFALPTQTLGRFLSVPGAVACGPVVVSPRLDLATTYPGARPVTRDPYARLGVWVLPGSATFSGLSAAGWLLPAATPEPLPAQAMTGILTVTTPVPELRSGRSAPIEIEARNTGTGSPWPSVAAFAQGAGAVRLAIRWYPTSAAAADATGADGLSESDASSLGEPASAPVASANLDLPATVLPGQAVRVKVDLSARAIDGSGLPPGAYVVSAGLYQEGVAAFSGPGATFLVRVG